VLQDTRAGQTAPSASAPDKKENTGPKNALKLARGGCKGGYCALCKMKHDNAKKHADSKAHRYVWPSVEDFLYQTPPTIDLYLAGYGLRHDSSHAQRIRMIVNPFNPDA
jgi:hypothetical protein